ncbi:MAG TPA: outer membrane lipoprotein-sorting protein [Candidatus Ozemobacteraceae bacterium]|nr:outer membrane lipoprotein-sorting protein [Candidatus Ozemobacteraceae bacterium]
MKIRWCLLAVAAVFLFGQNLLAMSADEVLQAVEDRYVGKTSKAETTMKLIDAEDKERNRTMLVYRRKVDNANKDNFIHFLNPPDIKDTTYLVNEKNREKQKWIYLSAFKNTRKILADDFGSAFVSSDFTYEDMEDIHASDYTCSDLKEETLDGEAVYSIKCQKKDGKTSYAHTIMKVSKEKMVPLKALMFDKGDPSKQIKEMTAKSLQKIQEIWTPMEVTMKDLRKGTSTVLAIKKIEYEVPLAEDVFSQRNMQK